jgi:Protein of unknown function (DUF3073)
MGRGRAKAKQTKVARRLKYYSPDTDLTALERELRARESADSTYAVPEDGDDEADEPEDEHDDTSGPWAAEGR